MDLLKGKVAVVTGGTRGIGFSIVRKYLEEGAKVVLWGSRKESAEKANPTKGRTRAEATRGSGGDGH